jgi:predicted MFS family arabinose efflux permease
VGQAAQNKRSSTLFLWLFALAWAGGAVAYVPFLTILLPLRVIAIAGPDSVRLLGIITFCGAVAASLSNIAFGWLSDRTGRRRPWIAAGLFLNVLLLGSVSLTDSGAELLAIVICWQVSVNMILGPLSAWAADRVPRHLTGFLGGLMTLSPALGAASGVIATMPGLAGANQRLFLVAAMVVACVLPVLVISAPETSVRDEPVADIARPPRRIAMAMWSARLLIQIAEAALFAYLLLYFRTLDPGMPDTRIARLFSGALAAAVPIAIFVGRRADAGERPVRPLALSALCCAIGLLAMAVASGIPEATFGYICFELSTIVFLSLHSGQTLRVLRHPAHRGRDLGLFNLTNTIPSMIMPWMTILMVPARGFDSLFVLLAFLALTASFLLFWLKRLD